MILFLFCFSFFINNIKCSVFVFISIERKRFERVQLLLFYTESSAIEEIVIATATATATTIEYCLYLNWSVCNHTTHISYVIDFIFFKKK